MSHPIETLATRLTAGLASERAVAVRLHDFVRDRIAFGFTPRLDAATPEETLAAGVGHTIPKTALFVALLRALGLRRVPALRHDRSRDPARRIPHGVHRLLPWEIPHCYAEVEVDDDWCDGQQPCPRRAALACRRGAARARRRPARLWRTRAGTCRWTGAGHAFAQLASPEMMVEDHGAFEDARAFRAGTRAAPGNRARVERVPLFANPIVAAASAQRVNERLDALRTRAHVVAAGRADASGAVARRNTCATADECTCSAPRGTHAAEEACDCPGAARGLCSAPKPERRGAPARAPSEKGHAHASHSFRAASCCLPDPAVCGVSRRAPRSVRQHAVCGTGRQPHIHVAGDPGGGFHALHRASPAQDALRSRGHPVPRRRNGWRPPRTARSMRHGAGSDEASRSRARRTRSGTPRRVSTSRARAASATPFRRAS